MSGYSKLEVCHIFHDELSQFFFYHSLISYKMLNVVGWSSLHGRDFSDSKLLFFYYLLIWYKMLNVIEVGSKVGTSVTENAYFYTIHWFRTKYLMLLDKVHSMVGTSVTANDYFSFIREVMMTPGKGKSVRYCRGWEK